MQGDGLRVVLDSTSVDFFESDEGFVPVACSEKGLSGVALSQVRLPRCSSVAVAANPFYCPAHLLHDIALEMIDMGSTSLIATYPLDEVDDLDAHVLHRVAVPDERILHARRSVFMMVSSLWRVPER